jgi:hypothetical protein
LLFYSYVKQEIIALVKIKQNRYSEQPIRDDDDDDVVQASPQKKSKGENDACKVLDFSSTTALGPHSQTTSMNSDPSVVPHSSCNGQQERVFSNTCTSADREGFSFGGKCNGVGVSSKYSFSSTNNNAAAASVPVSDHDHCQQQSTQRLPFFSARYPFLSSAFLPMMPTTTQHGALSTLSMPIMMPSQEPKAIASAAANTNTNTATVSRVQDHDEHHA